MKVGLTTYFRFAARLCENAWIGELQKLKFTMRLSEVMHEEIH
jgi:hypothetical protein